MHGPRHDNLNMENAAQRKVVDVQRGLFLVRYVDAEDLLHPPKVTVTLDCGPDTDGSVVLHPEHSTPVLWQPGACIVVRASASGKLIIEVDPHPNSSSQAASVRIERLWQGRQPLVPTNGRDGRNGATSCLDSFAVLGHLAGVGDRRVQSNEWLAGPLAPSRIEGIAIEWPEKPSDLDVRYAVELAQAQAISGRLMRIGSFAGTRGMSIAVTGIMLEMSGSPELLFDVEAIFLGASTMRARGRRIALSAPGGDEPLVGLRIGLDGQHTARAHDTATAAGTKPSHLRIFRGGSVETPSQIQLP